MRYQREDGVQVAQRGQVKARTVKRPAANCPWLPLEGKLRPQAVMSQHDRRGHTRRREAPPAGGDEV